MSPLVWLFIGCPAVSHGPLTPPVGDGVDTEAEVVTPPAEWSAVVTPPAPRFDEDLRCAPEAAPTEVASIAWIVGGSAWQGPVSTTTIPGDTIDDLDQSGGQRWACTVTLVDGTTRTSPWVEVGFPVPMVRAPAGRTHVSYGPFSGLGGAGTDISIRRPYWMAATELSRDDWKRWTTYDGFPDDYRLVQPDDFTLPAYLLTVAEAMWFTNLLSAADGLPPCYPCAGTGPDAVCTRPAQAQDCPGYRLPTMAEWILAYREGGAHTDPLPAGGYWESRYGDDIYGTPYNAPALGPNAPPDSMITDQCWIFRYMPPEHGNAPMPVATLLPNALGLYNMCSNLEEFFTDPDVPADASVVVDPLRPGDDHARGGVNSRMSIEGSNLMINPEAWAWNSSWGAIRLTRTIQPGAQP